jgi:protein-tyrosine-phosphatase
MTLSELNRRSLLAGVLFMASPAVAASASCPPPEVLFVCPVGTVKSAIAREILKRRAAARCISVRVRSRGVHPENHVSPGLAANLKADGIDPRAEPVQALTASDLVGPDIIVAFDEAARAPGLEHARIWDIPSMNDAYAQAKAALPVKIEALLDELSQRRCPA